MFIYQLSVCRIHTRYVLFNMKPFTCGILDCIVIMML